MTDNSSKQREIATITIAELYVKQGHFDKAITTYDYILEKEPDNKKILCRLMELREKISSSIIVKKNQPIKKEYNSGDVISNIHVWLGDITKYKDWQEFSAARRAELKICDNNETPIARLEGWLKNIKAWGEPREDVKIFHTNRPDLANQAAFQENLPPDADLNYIDADEPKESSKQKSSLLKDSIAQTQDFELKDLSCKDDIDAKESRLNSWLLSIRETRQSSSVATDEAGKTDLFEDNNAIITRLEDFLKLVRLKKRNNEKTGVITKHHIPAGKNNDIGTIRLQKWLNNIKSLRQSRKTYSCMANDSIAGRQSSDGSEILCLENWLGQIKRRRIGKNGF